MQFLVHAEAAEFAEDIFPLQSPIPLYGALNAHLIGDHRTDRPWEIADEPRYQAFSPYRE